MRLAFALVLTAALALHAPVDAKKPKRPVIKTSDLLAASNLKPFLPPALTPDNTWDLDLSDGGRVVIQLRPDRAPKMVERIKTLTKQGFYNGTLFHRIVTDFVDQGGDPKGDGTGGPGYKLPDEPPTNGYQAGSVAMANAGTGTTGSQFFLVVSDNGAKNLGGPPYLYSGLGTMDAAGLKVAQKINTFGASDSAGTPTKQVYVNTVTIKES